MMIDKGGPPPPTVTLYSYHSLSKQWKCGIRTYAKLSSPLYVLTATALLINCLVITLQCILCVYTIMGNSYLLQIHLRFTGLDILRPNICYAVSTISHEARQDMLKAWSDRLSVMMEEEPMYFPLMSQFQAVNGDMSQGFELPSDFKRERYNDGQYGATVGHHMNRKVVQDSE